MTLEVLEAGFLTTVQDLGRPGLGHLGVPPGGAADPWSHAVANLLVGNQVGAATLELTAAGPTIRATTDVPVALAGADLGGRVEPGGTPVRPGRSLRLGPGDVLALPGPPRAGLRAYLAVAGGIGVPVVLGSRSTCLAASFGGHEGRPLRAGDVVPIGGRSHEPAPGGATTPAAWPGAAAPPRRTDADGCVVVRITDGIAGSPAEVTGRRWVVTPASNRMGLRLFPETPDGDDGPAPREIASHGVVRGAIQLPPDGRPIVLLADHQPTGGYPVPAVVISADLAILGQLAPGEVLRFERVDLAEARRARAAERAAFDDAARRFRSDARWEELWQSAGG